MKLGAVLLLTFSAFAQTAVRLPAYSRQILPNGVVLDVIPRRDIPLVTIRVTVRGGIESEPQQLGGLSSVVAECLRRGTAKRSAEQFSLELDQLGASFNTSTGFEGTFISAEFLAKDFEKGLDLVADAIKNPAFPEAEVRKLIAQRVDGAKALKDNPSAAAAEYYRAYYFGAQHPYGQPADEISQSRIDRKDILAYHKQMFVGRNIIIVVAGDVESSVASAAVARATESVAAGTTYQWKKAPIHRQSGNRLAIVNKPDATETQFRIGLPGVDRTDADRVPLWLVNTLFGGRFTSILNDALRVNSGLTYGANSSYDKGHLPGRITINSYTGTQNTAKAVDMAIDLLKATAEKGITPEQLASAKTYLKGTYPVDHLETPDQLAEIVSEIELFDLNRGEVDDLFSRIDAVTLEKANAVAKRYLNPANLTFLLMGDAKNFAAGVAKYAAEPLRIEITEPGLRVSR
ncbi:MAG: insulinase family protein [Bryobacteraceae bacterium]|nr:insulinase family protein [Bryobacteraceae bacterium]